MRLNIAGLVQDHTVESIQLVRLSEHIYSLQTQPAVSAHCVNMDGFGMFMNLNVGDCVVYKSQFFLVRNGYFEKVRPHSDVTRIGAYVIEESPVLSFDDVDLDCQHLLSNEENVLWRQGFAMGVRGNYVECVVNSMVSTGYAYGMAHRKSMTPAQEMEMIECALTGDSMFRKLGGVRHA